MSTFLSTDPFKITAPDSSVRVENGVSVLGVDVLVEERPTTSGNNTLLTARPWTTATGTTVFAKDAWRGVRTRLLSPWQIDGLTIITTVAATGGTAELIFARYAVTPSGRPGALVESYASRGAIDITAAASTLTLLTPGLVIPAGDWFIACAWTGTAVGSPTLVSHSGLIPSTDSLTGANTGYAHTISAGAGASAPNPFVPAAIATAGIAIFAKIP